MSAELHAVILQIIGFIDFKSKSIIDLRYLIGGLLEHLVILTFLNISFGSVAVGY